METHLFQYKNIGSEHMFHLFEGLLLQSRLMWKQTNYIIICSYYNYTIVLVIMVSYALLG